MAFNLHLEQRAFALGREGCGSPEVIVSHDWLTALAAHRIARRWNLPHVWTVHDTVYGKRFGQIVQSEDRLAFRIESWAAKTADLVLANSRAIREEIHYALGRGERDVELLHCGIDPARFEEELPTARHRALRSVFAKPEELLITYSGRLDLEKGIDTLINAFSTFRQSFPMARLVIVGRGNLEPLILDHIGRLGLETAVGLVGYLESEMLRHVYQVSDIHVCPSHYEPFGLVAAEAMASGTPTVVSGTGGLTDIVTGNDVGRAFRPKDAASLAAILLELAMDDRLRRRLGEAGRKHVRKHFAWPILAHEAARLYQSARTAEDRS
jgi:glycogen(starch) synthase